MTPPDSHPSYPDDHLVEVWRLYAAGRDDDARKLLLSVWSRAMDTTANERDVRVAVRLLGRLGFVTDAPAEWAEMPARLTIYRAETSEMMRGLCWTLDPEIAAKHAERDALTITSGSGRKEDVLAYITRRGESEIVTHHDRVGRASDA
jgi:hypothetical protein